MAIGSEQLDSELHGLSEKEWRWSYWYLTHKDRMRKIFIISFLFLDIFLGIFVVYGLIKYFFIDYKSDYYLMQALPNDLVNYQAYRAANRPKDLSIDSILVLPVGQEKSDLTLRVYNSNEKWMISLIKYQFIVPGQETKVLSSYVLPLEEKYLTYEGVVGLTANSAVDFRIVEMNWQKVPPPASFANNRSSFDVQNIQYIPAYKSGISSRLDINRAEFAITNLTLYGYWEVNCQVLLYHGDVLVGINNVLIAEFDAMETVPVVVTWLGGLPVVDTVRVIPNVNFYDKANYMKIAGDVGELK